VKGVKLITSQTKQRQHTTNGERETAGVNFTLIHSKPRFRRKSLGGFLQGGMSNADLWVTKVKGASDEKIRRSFNAIALYNDTVATGDNDRLAITNQALRELSGVNGLLVGDWIKAHALEVISHNSKYGMQNAKDPSKTETYYNKRHGAEKITEILNLDFA
jgi:hypothetical protein